MQPKIIITKYHQLITKYEPNNNTRKQTEKI